MRRALLGLSLAAALPTAAMAADDINRIDSLNTQAEFRQLSEDLGSALSYKAIISAEPLGIAGFDISFEVTATKLENTAVWNQVTGSNDSTIYLPKVHIHKGLPLGLDIG